MSYVPQPRYTPHHKQQSRDRKQPLVTLDIDGRHLDRGTRTTETGVLTTNVAREMIERIQSWLDDCPDSAATLVSKGEL